MTTTADTGADPDGAAQPPCPAADQLAMIQGQLTDLPGISAQLAAARLDLRQDIRALRDQVADLPGIRTRLAEHTQLLAQITTLLTTIATLVRPGRPTADSDTADSDPPEDAA